MLLRKIPAANRLTYFSASLERIPLKYFTIAPNPTGACQAAETKDKHFTLQLKNVDTISCRKQIAKNGRRIRLYTRAVFGGVGGVKVPEDDKNLPSEQQIENLISKVDILFDKLNISADSGHIIADTVSTAGAHSDIGKLEDRLNELSIKFDVWQSNVEPMLASAQTAMDYDNIILAILGIIFALSSFWFQMWTSKSKRDAIDEAIRSIEGSIAHGILPEGSSVRKKLMMTILDSREFKDAVHKFVGYVDLSEDVEEEETLDEKIDLKDIKTFLEGTSKKPKNKKTDFATCDDRGWEK